MNIATLRANAAILTGLSLTAQSQVLKCVGKDGRVEFAASCPPGTTQQDTGVSNRPAPAPAAAKDSAKDTNAKGAPAAPKSLAERDAEFRKRQTEQKDAEAKAAQKSTEAEDRKQACQSAQSNLQALKNRNRMFRNDPKTGERIVYEEADYQREVPVFERLVADSCKT